MMIRMMMAPEHQAGGKGWCSTDWPGQRFPPRLWDLTLLKTMLFPSPVRILHILPNPAEVQHPYMKWSLNILFLMGRSSSQLQPDTYLYHYLALLCKTLSNHSKHICFVAVSGIYTLYNQKCHIDRWIADREIYFWQRKLGNMLIVESSDGCMGTHCKIISSFL